MTDYPKQIDVRFYDTGSRRYPVPGEWYVRPGLKQPLMRGPGEMHWTAPGESFAIYRVAFVMGSDAK